MTSAKINGSKRFISKVGGRLRLAHEDNDQLSINTEIIQYDQNVAVVKAVVETSKGSFSGIGMASLERDQRIAPAILELAETPGHCPSIAICRIRCRILRR